jgi:hypothetical protein
MCSLYFPGHKLLVRHILDVMHCEKNVCKNILKFLIGEKDKPQVWNDMEERGIRLHLHLQPLGNTGKAFYPTNVLYVHVFSRLLPKEID